jgi:hypothetical protein
VDDLHFLKTVHKSTLRYLKKIRTKVYPILTTIHYGSFCYPHPITAIVNATGLVTDAVVGNYRKGFETIATSDRDQATDHR